MDKKFILMFMFFMFYVSSVSGATYYISPTGEDSSGNGTDGDPWATLHKAFENMQGGDTLIIKNGTYTGEANCIRRFNHPPFGTSWNEGEYYY